MSDPSSLLLVSDRRPCRVSERGAVCAYASLERLAAKLAQRVRFPVVEWSGFDRLVGVESAWTSPSTMAWVFGRRNVYYRINRSSGSDG